MGIAFVLNTIFVILESERNRENFKQKMVLDKEVSYLIRIINK